MVQVPVMAESNTLVAVETTEDAVSFIGIVTTPSGEIDEIDELTDHVTALDAKPEFFTSTEREILLPFVAVVADGVTVTEVIAGV